MGASPASDETTAPGGRPASARAKRVMLVACAVLLLLGLGAGAAAYATAGYADTYEGKILPGARIAGIDVGGMTPRDALRAVRRSVRPELTRTIAISWKERTWKITPRALGARSNARSAVRAAVRSSSRASFLDLARMRWLDDHHRFTAGVVLRYPRAEVRRFVADIAARLDRDPADAALDYSSGWVEITEERTGRTVLAKRARARVMAALRGERARVDLPVAIVEPETTSEDFDEVLLVRIGENKLYLYDDGEITHSWPVATGLPEYPTPTGLYSIELKRYLPTWINPARDTWGKDLPKEIPPGPGNPLGLRALNWTAPAIRFHGTEAVYSLGYNASHGCVRMSNADVIELYDLVDVGTPIVSVQAGALKPLYTSPSIPDPARVASEGGDATGADAGKAGGKDGDDDSSA